MATVAKKAAKAKPSRVQAEADGERDGATATLNLYWTARVVAGDVPESLKDKRLISLDIVHDGDRRARTGNRHQHGHDGQPHQAEHWPDII